MHNNLIDQHFEDALRDLPEQKLSWRANRRIRRMLTQRTRELEGRMAWGAIFQRLVAVPVAMMLVLVTTGGYGFTSSTVVKGDFLYPVKSEIEPYLYPSSGTSEERITFHLWLSDRRYEEVNEILQRLGKPPLTSVPSAHAQDIENSENPLDQLLLETLQSAIKQVDYALLITDEIRDVKRVTSIKNEIRSSMVKQKEFAKVAAPLLQKVRLKQKRLSRQQTTRTISTPIPGSMTAAPETIVMESLPVTPLAFETVVDEPLELNTIAELIDDHLAFQESLLVAVEETVAQADLEGKEEVVLPVDEQLAEIDPTPGDDTSTKALTVHYEETRKVLTEEIEMEAQSEPKAHELSPTDVPTEATELEITADEQEVELKQDEREDKKERLRKVDQKLREIKEGDSERDSSTSP